ncbi:Phage terminase, small subunit [Caballeronia temeraria]|uniref:Phage terminase, small subunit n=1 Tax=Caballeronia temeraria TaxID=1777137 RepID=A0A157Z506_9BURK|nr:P27 family phage terminase small subunit [Caballeronia temeraria]SAK40621.1 Phage terminase, small subunit [Caballeronia temeraria]
MTAKPREPRPFPIAPPPIPPRSWGRSATRLWNRVLASFPEGHFRASDSEDLAVYVRAALEVEELEATIAKEGRVLTDETTKRRYAHPACVLRDRAAARLASAGSKLRLHLSSRMRSEDANTASKQPAAQRMRPWESNAYFEDGVTPPKKSNGKRAAPNVRDKYGF